MAITWQNISAPSFSGSNELLAESSKQITEGIEGFGKSVQDYQQVGIDKNTDQFLNRLKGAKTTGEYDKLVASGDFSQDNLAGANVDTGKILAALGTRGVALKDKEVTDITREDTIADAISKKKNRPIVEQTKALQLESALATAEDAENERLYQANKRKDEDEFTRQERARQRKSNTEQDNRTRIKNAFISAPDLDSRIEVLNQGYAAKDLGDKSELLNLQNQVNQTVVSEYEAQPITIGERTVSNKALFDEKMATFDKALSNVAQETSLGETPEGSTAASVTDQFISNNPDKLKSRFGGASAENIKTIMNNAKDLTVEVPTASGGTEVMNVQLTPEVAQHALTSVADFTDSAGVPFQKGGEEQLKDAIKNSYKLYVTNQKNANKKALLQTEKATKEEEYASGLKNYSTKRLGRAITGAQ